MVRGWYVVGMSTMSLGRRRGLSSAVLADTGRDRLGNTELQTSQVVLWFDQ